MAVKSNFHYLGVKQRSDFNQNFNFGVKQRSDFNQNFNFGVKKRSDFNQIGQTNLHNLPFSVLHIL